MPEPERKNSGGGSRPKTSRSLGEALLPALALAAVGFLLFLLGTWVGWKETFPFRPLIRDAFVGVEAVVEGRRTANEPVRATMWRTLSDPGIRRGTVKLDPERAADGPTLVLVGQYAHLVDLDGSLLHTWHLDVGEIVPEDVVRGRVVHQDRVFWRPARAFPDGDLLVMVDLQGATPPGLALVRLDRDSRPRWIYRGNIHHDFDIAPDGRILVLGQRVRERAPKGLKLEGPLLDEFVAVLSPEGVLEREVSILEAFTRTRYGDLVNAVAGPVRYDRGDYLHSNNIDIADAAVAARFDFVEEGQVLLSFREPGIIAIMDLQRGEIPWARRGEWFMQHDPDFLANGNLLIFDNWGDWSRGGRTRVIEYDPRSSAVVWEWAGSEEHPLWSRFRGDAQRLANGNTLVNENEAGRVMEVAPDGEVVWNYLCPFRYPGDDELLCHVMYAERYARGVLDFPLNGGRVPGDPGPGAPPAAAESSP